MEVIRYDMVYSLGCCLGGMKDGRCNRTTAAEAIQMFMELVCVRISDPVHIVGLLSFLYLGKIPL